MYIYGKSEPTISTFGNIGDYYVDTVAEKMYKLIDIITGNVNYQFVEVDRRESDMTQYIWEECAGSIPDWNQNDPDAPDYIKNRTHYETEDVIMPETDLDTIRTTDKGATYGEVRIDPRLNLEVGETYIVRVNGVEYEAVCYVYTPTSSARFPYLGVERSELMTDEVPFSIMSYHNDSWAYALVNDGKAIVEVVKKRTIQLDRKYLPSTVFVIDTESEEYSTTIPAYGNKVKDAILHGNQIYLFIKGNYVSIMGFRIMENTTDPTVGTLTVYPSMGVESNGSLKPITTDINAYSIGFFITF